VSLGELIAADAAHIIGGDLGEPIEYDDGTAPARTIRALVYRDRVSPLRLTRELAAGEREIHVLNDATTGVAAPKRGDRILVAHQIGDAPTWHRVDEVMFGNPGMWLLGCVQ
jgi:hypothetical protein